MLALGLLLLSGCGSKEPVRELPPPPEVTDTDTGGSEIEGGSGIEVTPLGAGWTATSVADGVIYYAYNGTDEISGKHQEVFAVDVDLNKPAYQVKLV